MSDDMKQVVAELVASLRKGAFHQDERIKAAIRLGEILKDEKLIKSAKKLRPINSAEADFVNFESLRQRDGKLWDQLNQALDANGYPPANTLKETMIGKSQATAEQMFRWFGDDAVVYSREIIDNAPYPLKGKCAEILGMAGKPDDVTLLAKVLEDTADVTRVSAIKALSQLDTDEAWQVIIDYSNNAQPASRTVEEIAIVLGNYDHPSSISVLTHIRDTDPLASRSAKESLSKLGH